MQLIVNGKPRELPGSLTVADLLQHFAVHQRAVAVELNGEVLARDAFDAQVLCEGDRVEIVRMIGGGSVP